MENLERALEVLGVGMGVVFLSLVLLMVITMALQRILRPRPPRHGPPVEAPGRTAPQQPREGPARDVRAVAAIAVAVARAMGSPPATAFPAGLPTHGAEGSAWRDQGRQAQMQSHGPPRPRRRDPL